MVETAFAGTAGAVTAISVALALLMAAAALLLMRDVRRLERRLAERLRAPQPDREAAPSPSPSADAVDAKTRFLATVSHEMRTPLNGVLGMAGLLAETGISAEQRTYVSAIKTSGEALLSLIEEILDFSKIDAGKLDLVIEPVALTGLIEGVAELLAPRAQDKGLEIAAYLAPALPARILTDGGRLRQVLINLAGNAIKFTEHGGVGIRVAAARDRLLIDVTDSGIGIAQDRIEAIFQAFEQADDTAARRYEGTGLGLAISRRIVAGLGGTITATSRPGEGSCFRVSLPLAAAEAPDSPDAPRLAGETLLIVSQSRFEAPYLTELLREAGAGVTLVADAASARAAIARAAFTGLIVDCALGPQVARTIATEAALAGLGLRLVMLSPYERRAFGPPAAAGFNGYLVKPLRARSVFARLSKLAPESPPDAPARAEPARLGLKVLLAEDNDINALLALRLLQRSGCEAVRVGDGLAALEAVRSANAAGTPYDLVLLDIRMPGLDGLETARRLRAAETSATPLRIVALTANAFPADREACFAAGIDAFVAKPLDQARLAAALGAPASPNVKDMPPVKDMRQPA